MAFSPSTTATTTLSLSPTSVKIPISSSSLSSSSLGSSSSLFFNKCSQRSSFRLIIKARTVGNGKRKGMSCNSMFVLGVPELAVIGGVVALVFGPSMLPQAGRSFGKTIKSFQQAAKEFETELRKEPEAVGAETSQANAIAESSGETTKIVIVS